MDRQNEDETENEDEMDKRRLRPAGMREFDSVLDYYYDKRKDTEIELFPDAKERRKERSADPRPEEYRGIPSTVPVRRRTSIWLKNRDRTRGLNHHSRAVRHSRRLIRRHKKKGKERTKRRD